MGLRFRRSIKIAPGVRVNLNKKSASVTFGPKGLKHTVSTTGKSHTTVGVAAISKMELLQSICRLISRGALISMAVILVVLPAALMLLDWVIRHTTMHWLVPESSNAKKSDKE